MLLTDVTERWLTSSKARSLRMIIAFILASLIVMLEVVQFAATSTVAIMVVMRHSGLWLENVGHSRLFALPWIAILSQLLFG